MHQLNHLIEAGNTYQLPDGVVYHILPVGNATYNLTAGGITLPSIAVNYASPSTNTIKSTIDSPISITAIGGTAYLIAYTGIINKKMRPNIENRVTLLVGESLVIDDGYKYDVEPEHDSEYSIVDSEGTSLDNITVSYESLFVRSIKSNPITIVCTRGALKVKQYGYKLTDTTQQQDLDEEFDYLLDFAL